MRKAIAQMKQQLSSIYNWLLAPLPTTPEHFATRPGGNSVETRSLANMNPWILKTWTSNYHSFNIDLGLMVCSWTGIQQLWKEGTSGRQCRVNLDRNDYSEFRISLYSWAASLGWAIIMVFRYPATEGLLAFCRGWLINFKLKLRSHLVRPDETAVFPIIKLVVIALAHRDMGRGFGRC